MRTKGPETAPDKLSLTQETGTSLSMLKLRIVTDKRGLEEGHTMGRLNTMYEKRNK